MVKHVCSFRRRNSLPNGLLVPSLYVISAAKEDGLRYAGVTREYILPEGVIQRASSAAPIEIPVARLDDGRKREEVLKLARS